MSPLKDWPSESDASISNNRNEDVQAIAEPERANEGDNTANEGETTSPMLTLNSNKDNNSQEDKQQPDPRLMLSPIDLSSTELRDQREQGKCCNR